MRFSFRNKGIHSSSITLAVLSLSLFVSESFRDWLCPSKNKFHCTPPPVLALLNNLDFLLCTNSDHVVLWIAFGTGFTFLVSVFPFVWVGYIWSRLKDPHRELDRIPEPKSPLVRFFYKSSITVTNSLLIRTLIYLIVSFLISTFAIIDVVSSWHINISGWPLIWQFD